MTYCKLVTRYSTHSVCDYSTVKVVIKAPDKIIPSWLGALFRAKKYLQVQVAPSK